MHIGSVVTSGDPNLLYKRTKRIGQGYFFFKDEHKT
jgi:hypothetical protein